MTGSEETVYVVDDDKEMLGLYDALLDSVGLRRRLFSSGDAFLSEYNPEWTGGVVLDLRMPGQGGMDVLKHLLEKDTLLTIMIVSGFGEIRTAVEALRMGACNFIQKPFSNQEFLVAVQQMLRQGKQKASGKLRLADFGSRIASLSGREREIAELVSQGLSSRDISERLGISPRTVEVHRAHVLDKLGCQNAIEISVMMTEMRLFESAARIEL